MRGIMVLISATALFLLSINIGSALAEGEDIVVGGAMEEVSSEPEIQWLWGEVVSIDIEKKALLVKYLDYEIEEEKEATITVNAETSYENVNSLIEIKPKDSVSVDYVMDADGRIIARNIIVENPEFLEAVEEGITP